MATGRGFGCDAEQSLLRCFQSDLAQTHDSIVRGGADGRVLRSRDSGMAVLSRDDRGGPVGSDDQHRDAGGWHLGNHRTRDWRMGFGALRPSEIDRSSWSRDHAGKPRVLLGSANALSIADAMADRRTNLAIGGRP